MASDGVKKIRRMALVGHDNDGSARLLETILEAFPDCTFLLVQTGGLYYRKSIFASIFKLLREASWIFVFVRFLELVKHKILGRTLGAIAKERNIRSIATRDINSEDMLTQLREFAPDLLVSLYTMQIYKRDVIELPAFGAITCHPSVLPNYRGLEVFFWVLANNERETGVSVFFLSERIDAGSVIWQEKVPIDNASTVASLYREVTQVGGRGLVAAIKAIDGDQIVTIPQEGQGSYYSMPDGAAVRRFLSLGRKFF